jgi:hypothetical protein
MICTPTWDLCTGTLRICSFHFNVGSNTLTEHYPKARHIAYHEGSPIRADGHAQLSTLRITNAHPHLFPVNDARPIPSNRSVHARTSSSQASSRQLCFRRS